jgi:hypothetical protein
MAMSDWEHIWNQVPEVNRSPVIRAEIEAASPKLAISILKDLFMVDNPSDRGLVCSLDGAVLVPILMEFYAIKGGPDVELERAMWQRLLDKKSLGG